MELGLLDGGEHDVLVASSAEVLFDVVALFGRPAHLGLGWVSHEFKLFIIKG